MIHIHTQRQVGETQNREITVRTRLGEGWDKVGTWLGQGWDKVGTRLGHEIL